MPRIDSLFERLFGPHGPDPFGRRRPQSADAGGARRARSADRRASLTIDLEEAFHGTTKPVTIVRRDPCPACGGDGYRPETAVTDCPKCGGRGRIVHIRDTGRGRTKRTERCTHCAGTGELPGEVCPDCDGDGHVDREATVDVTVPAGVESGQTLRLEDAGDVGARGGDRGDVLAEVDVADHPAFVRRADDLYTGYPLSFPQAVFGTTVEVPTLDESVALSIPAGTQSGETFRLRGEGMPQFRRTGRGDLYVRAEVITPEELSEDRADSLADFADASEFDGADDRTP